MSKLKTELQLEREKKEVETQRRVKARTEEAARNKEEAAMTRAIQDGLKSVGNSVEEGITAAETTLNIASSLVSEAAEGAANTTGEVVEAAAEAAEVVATTTAETAEAVATGVGQAFSAGLQASSDVVTAMSEMVGGVLGTETKTEQRVAESGQIKPKTAGQEGREGSDPRNNTNMAFRERSEREEKGRAALKKLVTDEELAKYHQKEDAAGYFKEVSKILNNSELDKKQKIEAIKAVGKGSQDLAFQFFATKAVDFCGSSEEETNAFIKDWEFLADDKMEDKEREGNYSKMIEKYRGQDDKLLLKTTARMVDVSSVNSQTRESEKAKQEQGEEKEEEKTKTDEKPNQPSQDQEEVKTQEQKSEEEKKEEEKKKKMGEKMKEFFGDIFEDVNKEQLLQVTLALSVLIASTPAGAPLLGLAALGFLAAKTLAAFGEDLEKLEEQAKNSALSEEEQTKLDQLNKLKGFKENFFDQDLSPELAGGKEKDMVSPPSSENKKSSAANDSQDPSPETDITTNTQDADQASDLQSVSDDEKTGGALSTARQEVSEVVSSLKQETSNSQTGGEVSAPTVSEEVKTEGGGRF